MAGGLPTDQGLFLPEGSPIPSLPPSSESQIRKLRPRSGEIGLWEVEVGHQGGTCRVDIKLSGMGILEELEGVVLSGRGDGELLDGEVGSGHLAGVAGERGQVVEKSLERTHLRAVRPIRVTRLPTSPHSRK